MNFTSLSTCFYYRFLGLGFLLFLYSSCTSTPNVKENKINETVELNKTVKKVIAPQFESYLKFRHDTEVAIYLRKIAEKLVNSNPELQGSGIGIWLIKDKNKKWLSYGLPGHRIYLSVGVLREVEYENEIAALIAVQLAHIMNKSILKRLVQIANSASSDITGRENAQSEDDLNLENLSLLQTNTFRTEGDYFGPNGILSFSDTIELEAVQAAVRVLYHAGYDARGIISLYNRYRENPDHSPYVKDTVLALIEMARREIAMYAPVRNPIVRTQEYILIQKRMRQL